MSDRCGLRSGRGSTGGRGGEQEGKSLLSDPSVSVVISPGWEPRLTLQFPSYCSYDFPLGRKPWGWHDRPLRCVSLPGGPAF